jgi:dUTP pyrophosphatase
MLKVVKHDCNAVIPSRAHPEDIGLDLTAISKHKDLPNGGIMYDTGISVCPPEGYYVEILPRSSMSKTGWMLANSVGTVDPNYTGNLYIALIKVRDNVEELPLPFCKCQIIIRKAEYFDVEEVNNLSETSRGSGGFGSTGERTSN